MVTEQAKGKGGTDPAPRDAAEAAFLAGQAAGQECLEAALEYLSRGWPVLALCPPDHVGIARVSKTHLKTCKTPGKRPWHTWAEFQDRLPTEAEVRGWWRSMPNSNIGMALGRMIRVDTDGPAGEDLLRRWSGGDLPPTLEFTGDTTKGGRGLLYLAPPGVVLHTTSQLPQEGEELRLQGLGAQTVLPPSRHRKGMRYAWKPGHGPKEIEAAPAPRWLVERLRAHRPAPFRPPRAGRAPANPGAVALALRALAHLNPQRAAAYDSWLHVGMGLHAVDPSDEMLRAWDQWSEQCEEKHQPGECAAKWATFSGDGGLGLRDLLRWARQDTGWIPEARRPVPCHTQSTLLFTLEVS
jgi:hypothetical protein